MVISKKTIIFQGFKGGPTCSREVGPTFSKGRGVQMLISIGTHIHVTFVFRGSGHPIPLSGYAQDSVLTCDVLCRQLITFANSLYPDQDRPKVGPDLDSNCLLVPERFFYQKCAACKKLNHQEMTYPALANLKTIWIKMILGRSPARGTCIKGPFCPPPPPSGVKTEN